MTVETPPAGAPAGTPPAPSQQQPAPGAAPAGPAAGAARESVEGGTFTHADGTVQAFPEGTPTSDMSPEQQAAYWRDQSRKQERIARSAPNPERLAELQRKADEFDALAAASQTDQQRAVAEAEQRAAAAAAAKYGARLVDASISAAVAGRVPAEQLATTLGPLNREWFLTDDGEVDTDKVATFAASLAPVGPGSQGPGGNVPRHGLGFRQQQQVSAAEVGRAEAAKRFPKPTN